MICKVGWEIREHERKPVIARLAAPGLRSISVMLVTLRKGIGLGEVQERIGQKKAL